jgi:hypothetical protein
MIFRFPPVLIKARPLADDGGEAGCLLSSRLDQARPHRRLVESTREPYRRLREEMFGVLHRDERENLTATLQKFYDANLYRLG